MKSIIAGFLCFFVAWAAAAQSITQEEQEIVDGFKKLESEIMPIDNDALAAKYEQTLNILEERLSPFAYLQLMMREIHHKYFHFKVSYEEVMSYLTPEMEENFDLYIFVNVSNEKWGNPNAFVPSQRMRVLRKKNSSDKVFIRDPQNNIVGIQEGVLGVDEPALPGLETVMKVSTGASQRSRPGDSYVDTFSGLFRINTDKSLSRRFQEGMWDSLYTDVRYQTRSQKVSGIAIHGTTNAGYGRLGTQASHGCVRVHRDHSAILWDYVMNKMETDYNLPSFGPDQLPTFDRLPRIHEGVTKPGKRALMIYFYGYEGQKGLDI